jgi:hypothetical protein
LFQKKLLIHPKREIVFADGVVVFGGVGAVVLGVGGGVGGVVFLVVGGGVGGVVFLVVGGVGNGVVVFGNGVVVLGNGVPSVTLK